MCPPSTRPAREREGETGRLARRVTLYEALLICRPGSSLPSIIHAALDTNAPSPRPTHTTCCRHLSLPPSCSATIAGSHLLAEGS